MQKAEEKSVKKEAAERLLQEAKTHVKRSEKVEFRTPAELA